MLETIKALRCGRDVKIIESRTDAPSKASSDAAFLVPLGVHERKNLTLVSEAPEHPAEAVLLADVLRIGRAALALESARQEERSRAALWPASPVEEQAGALFLAEEMQTLLATARRIAPTTVPVLITGETGTGKEVLARTIHAYSTAPQRPSCPSTAAPRRRTCSTRSCSAIAAASFTGAIEHFSGVIRAAAGGTLFLDEIGETTLDVQPKLLRFLEVERGPPDRRDAAGHASTSASSPPPTPTSTPCVASGRFREDLFYRLNIVRLHVPPLRERRVEIPALANHYLHKHAQECGKGDLRLAEETMEYLVLYRWPGNVRQLANEMRRLAALAEPGAVLMPEHLSPEIAASRRTIPASAARARPDRGRRPPRSADGRRGRSTSSARWCSTRSKQCGGRMEETAAMLGLSRKGLYLKRQRFGLEPPGNRPIEVA